MFTKIRNFLSGRKTYLVASLMVLISIVNIVSGDMSFSDLLKSEDIWVLLNGVGLGSLRAGVNKINKGE